MTWSDPKELWHVFRGMLLPLCEIQRIIDSEDDDNKYVIESSDEEELPFACFICRKEFVKPVVTK